MKKTLYVLLLATALTQFGCADDFRKWNPTHVPPPVLGKAALQVCAVASPCDIVEVVMNVTGATCKARFNFQVVKVQSNATAPFTLVDYQRMYLFRFTSSPIGIDINYGGDPAAFAVGFGDAEQRTIWVKSLAIDEQQRGKLYPFAIHTEWSSDSGRTWAPCVEVDPLIANN